MLGGCYKDVAIFTLAIVVTSLECLDFLRDS